MNKWLGESEKNVRDLFADAENDQRARGRGDMLIRCFSRFGLLVIANGIRFFSFSGDQSDLHVIIFDEIDAICKVNDSSIIL